MEEALRLLNSAGAPTMPLASRGPPLAPGLQQEISDALVELRAESLLGYLQVGRGQGGGRGRGCLLGLTVHGARSFSVG